MSDAEEKTGKRGGSGGRNTAYAVPPSQQVLVVLMNNRRDLEIARNEHWYRIPVKSAPRAIHAARIAFYQTKIFKEEGWAIHYWADVRRRSVVRRVDLLPDQPLHPRAGEQYYKLELGNLNRLPTPIVSRRGRRIVFIATTWEKFRRAREINDLYHESPLEDELWEQFKAQSLEAERQYYLTAKRKNFCLDFALFCARGNVDVECDGDRWHADVERIPEDNDRNNALEAEGWSVLRFNTRQLREEMPHCLKTVRETVNRYGGLVTPENELRFYAQGNDRHQQLNLFQETAAEYDARAGRTPEPAGEAEESTASEPEGDADGPD
jgi:very-short-patch-repair endonuclease